MELVLDDICGRKFGEFGQVEILSVIGKVQYTKVYSAKCNICAEDEELFGDGVFKTHRSNILKGYLPCGCGARPLWNEDQFKVICNREADKRSFKFLGFSGEYKGNKTKLRLECNLHGVWTTTDINHFLKGRGCKGCKAITCSEVNIGNTHSLIDDNTMIQSFLKLGSFHPGTKFKRCDPATMNRSVSDWIINCPECKTEVIAKSSNIKLGYRLCACEKPKQKYAYINIVSDKESILAIKYGIATNPEDRLKKQAWKAIYPMTNFGIWEFEDYQSCRNAETYCKRNFQQSLSKEEMPDGFTETTYPYNIDKIIKIYEDHGGVQISANC